MYRKMLQSGFLSPLSLTAALALLLIGFTPARADDDDLKGGARRAGHTAGLVVRDVGQGAKQVGMEIGHGAKRAGKEIGGAAREGGREFRRALKGEK